MGKRKPTIINQSILDNKANIELRVESDILYFQGHFDQFKLLPGVAQIDWAVFFAQRNLNISSKFIGMDVIKFQEPILPDSTIRLLLDWDQGKQKLAFKYVSMDGDRLVVHSTGKMKFAQKNVKD